MGVTVNGPVPESKWFTNVYVLAPTGVNTTEFPAHIEGCDAVMVIVGAEITVMDTVSLLVQALAVPMPDTVTTVLLVGCKKMVVAEEPVLQVYVLAPEAVSTMLFPAQTLVLGFAVIVTSGVIFTVTSLHAEAMQPLEPRAVT